MQENNSEKISISMIPSKKSLPEFKQFFLLFIFYAFVGWLLETAYAYYVFGHFVKRGFLFGPICPIYGCGAIILITLLKKYQHKHLRLFVYAIVIFSVFEYLAGFALDALFASRWWDYTNDFLNLNGRISIFFSFIWGFIALFFFHFVHPFVTKLFHSFEEKLPFWAQNVIFYSLSILFLADLIFSACSHLAI